MTHTSDVLIVGGGIIGLLTAHEFVNAGASTALIERQHIGREASWAGGGMLCPLYPWRQPEATVPLWLESVQTYPQLSETLHQNTRIDPECIRSGILVCDNPDIENARTWCQHHSFQFQQPTSHEIDSLIPELHTTVLNPLWLPDVAQVRSPRLLKALRADLLHREVKLFENQEVIRLVKKGVRIIRIETHTGNFSADHVILATGAWSGLLGAPYLPKLQIVPVKGQMLMYKTKPGLLGPMILDNGRYLIPRKDGHILVGSTVEYSGFDKTTTIDARKSLERFAVTAFAPLSNYPVVNHWAGLRPSAPSGIPYIDRHPKIANLSINCGHFRNGIGIAPASARLIADLVLGRSPSVAPEPYSLDRDI